MDTLYPLLPIGIGLSSLLWLLRDILGARRLRSRGEQAVGEVVGYQETSGTARMIVRFHTDDGEEILAAHDNTSWSAARYGDLVTVSYDPRDPRRARVVSGPWMSAWPRGIFVALAAGVLLIGCLLGYLAWA
ncbi:DUF3592 domain-containing protein [Actinorugispora endophytica]|uniref:Uncharacterized protein DUF3592 n=1 Tax=Actinorugispora endophytica TaxID=1605990 RepID=A0A4R6UMN1_9ACTN|nr:DUF3592 domain-containing protein [Actinorugispora endophytica]TDQ48002.1 uncharacterized protein DUF3592 [Actinorugispora endophytica]